MNRLVKAEKLASVALVAIHLNRGLGKPIERIRESAKFLSRRNAFDADSAHAVGRIFDETEKIYAISEQFNENFSTYCGDVTERQTATANPEQSSQESRVVYEPTGEQATTPD